MEAKKVKDVESKDGGQKDETNQLRDRLLDNLKQLRVEKTQLRDEKTQLRDKEKQLRNEVNQLRDKEQRLHLEKMWLREREDAGQ